MHERTAILPYGKQRLLEIAVAVACRPRVLLLDEPAAGVPEEERHEILATIAALPQDVTVLLIEHDMDLVFQLRRPHLRARQRRAVRGRRARGDRARPPREGGLSRRGRSMADLLAVEGLSAGYGEAVVLGGMSLKIAEGSRLALLGRNGTGKTTLINTIVGVTRIRRHHPPRRPRHHAAAPRAARRAGHRLGRRRSATSSARSPSRRT